MTLVCSAKELAAAEAALGQVLPLSAAPEAVADLQRRKLDVLLSFARRHVPYYARMPLPQSPDLADLPPMDKAALMYGLPDTCSAPGPSLEELRGYVPPDERLSQAALYRDRYYVLRTSGTTGFVGFFLWDAEMARVADASATRFVAAPKDLPKPVVAVAPVVLWDPLRGPLEGLYSIPVGAGLEATIEKLHELKPRAMLGSTGFVAELAEEQLAGRLRIAPEVVNIGSEQCTPLQWRRICEAWKVEPSMQYGLSEAGLIASRCCLGNWHIHADTVILELLDERGNPAAPGQPCARALLTRLFGPAQPIIRYELGDALIAGPSTCPCGGPFPTLAGIGGRTRALLWLRSRRGGVLSVGASVVIAALELTPGLMRYQMTYERPEVLEIALVSEGPLDESGVRSRISATLREQGAIPPAVVVRRGSVPDRWAAPPGSKEHHLRLSVTRESMLAAVRGGT